MSSLIAFDNWWWDELSFQLDLVLKENKIKPKALMLPPTKTDWVESICVDKLISQQKKKLTIVMFIILMGKVEVVMIAKSAKSLVLVELANR